MSDSSAQIRWAAVPGADSYDVNVKEKAPGGNAQGQTPDEEGTG
ncbi:hypothetical protein [Streptomyces sp. cg35]